MECGRLNDAKKLQIKVKDYLTKMLGRDHQKTQDIALALARTYWCLTQWNEALELQQEALSGCIESLGRGHYRTLQMMNSLGKSQCSRGRFKEALKLHEDAIEGMSEILSPDHEDIFRAKTNLGVVHQKYFQWQRAKILHIEAVEGLTKALGPTDDDTLSAMENLAMTNLEIGGDSLHDARDMINEVVEQRCLEREAETDLRALIEIATGNYGDDHIAILLGRAQLAKVLVRQQRYSEAEEILLDVIKPSRYKAGAREEGEHPDRLFAMWYTVECYQLQGKLEGAIELCTEILDSLRMLGGGQHPLAIQVEERLSELREHALAPPDPPPCQSSNPGV